MKTLKFAPDLVELILQGNKTSTWRLFDDKNLATGDTIQFVNKCTSKVFGEAIVTSCVFKTLGSLTDDDWIGHERFPSEEAMYATYKSFYGDTVNSDSEVKILHFIFTETKPY